MLKIRLQRVGRIHEPSFRLVLTDSKNSTKSGRSEEVLGSYDPRKKGEVFKTDRIKHWLSLGAGMTESVNNLLIKNRVISGKKIDVSAVSKKEPQAQVAPVEVAPVEVAPEAPVPEAVAEAPAEIAPEAPVETPTEPAPQEPSSQV